jgi:hypothetical protein
VSGAVAGATAAWWWWRFFLWCLCVGPGDGVPDAAAGPWIDLAGAAVLVWACAVLANTAVKPIAATALSPVACTVSMDRRRRPWSRASSAGPSNSAG